MLVPRGLVSFARPGGNATGINFPLAEVAVKELGLLHEVAPPPGGSDCWSTPIIRRPRR
jgi:hypothetical protein